MKLFALLAALLTFTVSTIESRADGTNAVAATIRAAEAAKWIGKQVTVTGLLAQVTVRPSITFLNFDKRYPESPFAAIIRSKNTNEFENLPALRGKAVCVTGKVQEYNGKPEMELTRKAQLRLLSEAK